MTYGDKHDGARPSVLDFEGAHTGLPGAEHTISTGAAPESVLIDSVLNSAYHNYKDLTHGAVANYIPTLGAADPNLFGICVAEVDGAIHVKGAALEQFSIQSISKAFVFALVSQSLGHDQVKRLVGVNNTGLPFNSVMALELNGGNPLNPMVNAGALVTTALAYGATAAEKWQFIVSGLSGFAGRELEVDPEVYASESATNQRNRALAQLLDSYGHLPFDPVAITDVYTRQCSLRVSTKDLAIMAATLADGGMNPVTGRQVVSATVARDTLAVMATTGMYEMSGDWLYDVGMPGKSGVSGAIITVAPGKAGMATFSPPLDSAGNSVRGKNATRFVSQSLGLNIFASNPKI